MRRHLESPILLVLLLIALIVAVVMWRGDAPGEASDARPSAQPRDATVTRSWNNATLQLPPTWRVLDRAADHVTWGSSDRLHTVTLATTEASLLPLPGVVGAIARDAASAIAGSRVVGRPKEVPLESTQPRRDAAMSLRLVIDRPAGVASGAPLELQQVWRRDSRGERDIVATWTSSDGTWPIDPARSVPGTSVR